MQRLCILVLDILFRRGRGRSGIGCIRYTTILRGNGIEGGLDSIGRVGGGIFRLVRGIRCRCCRSICIRVGRYRRWGRIGISSGGCGGCCICSIRAICNSSGIRSICAGRVGRWILIGIGIRCIISSRCLWCIGICAGRSSFGIRAGCTRCCRARSTVRTILIENACDFGLAIGCADSQDGTSARVLVCVVVGIFIGKAHIGQIVGDLSTIMSHGTREKTFEFAEKTTGGAGIRCGITDLILLKTRVIQRFDSLIGKCSFAKNANDGRGCCRHRKLLLCRD